MCCLRPRAGERTNPSLGIVFDWIRHSSIGQDAARLRFSSVIFFGKSIRYVLQSCSDDEFTLFPPSFLTSSPYKGRLGVVVTSRERSVCVCRMHHVADNLQQERSLVEEQWRRREKDLLNLLNQAQVRKSGDCADARDSEETGLAYVMQEVEDLRGTVMRLSLEKETLLRQQSVANASCSHAREEGSRAFGMVENRKEHAKVVFKGRLTAIFRNEIGGADNVEDDAPLGVWSGGRGIESGQNEVAQRCARSSFQANLRDHRHSPGCFADDARTAAEDGRTGEGEEGEGRDGMADKGVRHVDNEDKNHRYYYECQNYRRCRRPRSGFVDIESETGDKCHSDVEETSGGCPRLEEDGELLAGKGNHCRKGWIGVNATLMHAEDEEQLAPRDGPAPVPSLLMPRHPRARPMAAPALLRF